MFTEKSLLRTGLYVALLFVVGMIGQMAYRRYLDTQALEKVQAAGNPTFTLMLTEVIKDRMTGPERISQQITIARRSDGSRSERRVFLPSQPGEHHKRLIILPNRQHIQVWDSVSMKTTGAPWPSENIVKFNLSQPLASGDCMINGRGQQTFTGYKVAGRELIGGLLTVKMVKTDPLPVEAWHALELGCEEVQRKIGFKGCCGNNPKPDDPITNTSELRFVSLVLGEPSSELFDVTSLKEVPPSEGALAIAKGAGFPQVAIEKMAREYQESDKSYWRARDSAR